MERKVVDRRIAALRAALFLLCMTTVFLLCMTVAGLPLQPSRQGSASGVSGPDALPSWRGFVDDAQCAECHAEIAESFESLGMARSFSSTGSAERIERFEDAGGVVEDHRLRYQVRRRGEELIYSQWQVGPDGSPIHRWERSIDWVVGSGSTSRVYFTQAADGTLYELPIAWYSQPKQWGIKPGAVREDREAGVRVVLRGCMFCHNAVPPSPTFDDGRFAAQAFPDELPEGIGCQRCHGPGQEHVLAAHRARAAMAAPEPPSVSDRRALRDAVRASILDPSDLSAERRRDVCAQCHHQPSVALFGQRRLERGDYQFAAGDALHEFLLKVDLTEGDSNGQPVDAAERFEINHHGYRLERSPCFQQSPPGSLECTACHDAHRKPPRAEILERTRTKCLSCHLPGAEQNAADRLPGSPSAGAAHYQQADCVACHMPRRRTRDVVHVVMTDHRIQTRAAPESERLASIVPHQPRVLGVERMGDPWHAGQSPERTVLDELVLGSSFVRSGVDFPVEELEQALKQAAAAFPDVDLTEPTMRLAQVRLGRSEFAEVRRLLEPFADDPQVGQQAKVWLAVAAARENRVPQALELIERAIADSGGKAVGPLYAQRAGLRRRLGDPAACRDFERAIAENDLLATAWLQAGQCRARDGDLVGAAEALGRGLAIDPNLDSAAVPLARILREIGRDAEAARVMLHHTGSP